MDVISDSILLPLEDSIQRLKRINQVDKSPNDAAHVYKGALAFFCHLKKDQAVLFRHERSGQTCLPLTATPAIASVLTDHTFFLSLLRCLQPPTPTESDPEFKRNPPRPLHSGPPSRVQNVTPSHARQTSNSVISWAGNRKRGLSFSNAADDPPPKISKSSSTLSPMMSVMKQKTSFSDIKVSLPTQVIAATILYQSLRHFNHWPAQLLRAYADDCFGPRLWVDKQECALLVANLQLAHAASKDLKDTVDPDDALNDAKKIANHFTRMIISGTRDEVIAKDNTLDTSNIQELKSKESFAQHDSRHEPSLSESDSDSGDEEILDESNISHMSSRSKLGADDSSSSGEEEVIAMLSSSNDKLKENPENETFTLLSSKINLSRIRPRYFGINLELGLAAITQALESRLMTKTKHNSKLLQALPDFCMVPGVRALVAANLERWLQSPALSGAARTLFSNTVHHLKNCDPPLPEDLETVEAILDMELKANQFNVHLENVTLMVKRIPTSIISRHAFRKLLEKALKTTDSNTSTLNSDCLKMMCAIHMTLPRSLSHDGLATAIIDLLAKQSDDSTQRERWLFLRKVNIILRQLVSNLGPTQFDGCGLIEAMLSVKILSESWSIENEEFRARILLECVTLLVPHGPDDLVHHRGKGGKKIPRIADGVFGFTLDEISNMRRAMTDARRFLISWSVTNYLPRLQINSDAVTKDKHANSHQKSHGKKGNISELSPSDFTSILLNDDSPLSLESSCPIVVKCILFMVDPESPEMQQFLYPEGPPMQGDATMNEQIFRLKLCYRYGSDLDISMLTLIIKSVSSTSGELRPETALALIEHLFTCCKVGRDAAIRIHDIGIIWDMYKLVENCAELTKLKVAAENADNGDLRSFSSNKIINDEEKSKLPRLANPGRWWRVTALALIMISSSPSGIGAALYEQHPTARALIKMVTSGRYRFPTIDCDDHNRDEMKKGESESRHLESDIAEMFFLPPKPEAKKANDEIMHQSNGSRASARQRHKNERKLREKREQEAAEALSLLNSRKKMLKAAQKNIMIWDPHGPARKPPKESVNLILAAEKMFGLSIIFQKCKEPDFVQASIGDTSREAIERAYDWLIPIISSIPSVIDRLPASASCYLLLRVYGSGSDDDSKLRELSTPLLEHVRKTVTGCFGLKDAIGATNLLLADVADRNPARRRCARRVFEETLSHLNEKVEDQSFSGAKCTWLQSLLLLDHVDDLLPDAIRFISQALFHEKGRVLRAFTLSLKNYIELTEIKGIDGTWNLSYSLCELISNRQSICSDALSRFPDLRLLVFTVVHDEFQSYFEMSKEGTDAKKAVRFAPCQSNRNGRIETVILPLQLLQSACVLLSIAEDLNNAEDISSQMAIELANVLMPSFNKSDSSSMDSDAIGGVASAVMVLSGDRAVSVEGWVMLAKSQSDNIARRAALSAPAKFLPRLLLCSGLPQSSLLTMIDRIGKLGEKSCDMDKVYRELLMPSATTGWGIGQVGSRRETARKIIGRLSAYLSASKRSLEEFSHEVSFTFIRWLSDECRPPGKSKKSKPLKKFIKPVVGTDMLQRITEAESMLQKVNLLESDSEPFFENLVESTPSFQDFPEHYFIEKSGLDHEHFIVKCCECQDSDSLESWIDDEEISEVEKCNVAILLMENTKTDKSVNQEWIRAVERLIPKLSASQSNQKLWKILFSSTESNLNMNSVVVNCSMLWCPIICDACRDWILSSADALKDLNTVLVVTFLLQTSNQHTPQSDLFQGDGMYVQSWLQKRQNIDKISGIALHCAIQLQNISSSKDGIDAWMALLLIVAESGKIQANYLIQRLLQETDVESNADSRKLVSNAALRIYCNFPFYVSLRNSKLRSILMEGSRSIDWHKWHTPMDEILYNMIHGVKAHPIPRLVHGLIDLSKSHPLMLLRKLKQMADILEEDAFQSPGSNSNFRNRLQSDNIDCPATTILYGKEVKVIIRHWGYSFTEPLWISFVDILLSLPREVLISCGMDMGLIEFMATYLRLFIVQCDLQLRDKASSLRSRYMDLVSVLQKDASIWNKWLLSTVPGLNPSKTTRAVLVRCSLITQDVAIESLRQDFPQNSAQKQ